MIYGDFARKCILGSTDEISDGLWWKMFEVDLQWRLLDEDSHYDCLIVEHCLVAVWIELSSKLVKQSFHEDFWWLLELVFKWLLEGNLRESCWRLENLRLSWVHWWRLKVKTEHCMKTTCLKRAWSLSSVWEWWLDTRTHWAPNGFKGAAGRPKLVRYIRYLRIILQRRLG